MIIDSLPTAIRAIAYTIVPLGSIHLTISFVSALMGDWEQANIFHILAFDIIWPELGQGTTNLLISQIFWLVPVFWYFYFKKQQKRNTSNS